MILTGDCLEILPTLAAESVQCCVTSPPYYGLRDYGCAGQIGLEPTPEAYVEKLVAVFREVRRVLRPDGCVFLNLGDSYANVSGGHTNKETIGNPGLLRNRDMLKNCKCSGLKEKDLIGIPWRVAFALQADGWYLRQDIIWAKPNPMPESVTDRCTKAHEYIFLLTKSARYFYDCDAVREKAVDDEKTFYAKLDKQPHKGQRDPGGHRETTGGFQHATFNPAGRNRRSVWTITTKPFKEAHFATFPPEIPEICIKAGSKPGDTILDPFSGAGTTGNVAERLGREYIGIELNPAYAEMGERRIEAVRLPLFREAAPCS